MEQVKVGRELLSHLQKACELIGQISDNAKVSFGYISVGPKISYRHTKEQADELVGQLVGAGFELTNTKRDSYQIERELSIPDFNRFTVSIRHEPTEEDRLEVLKENVEKAQAEWDALHQQLQTNEEVGA